MGLLFDRVRWGIGLRLRAVSIILTGNTAYTGIWMESTVGRWSTTFERAVEQDPMEGQVILNGKFQVIFMS